MQPVLIIGAGISGLICADGLPFQLYSTKADNTCSIVAQVLKLKKIPSIVFEAKAKGKAGNHGLWLSDSVVQPLLSQLRLSSEEFTQAVSVSAELKDAGCMSSNARGMRANKRRLLDQLAVDLDIRWEHKLKDIRAGQDRITASFDNDNVVEGSLLIGCDGVHSKVRALLLPHLKPEVLPYVAINGQRRTPIQQYLQGLGSTTDFSETEDKTSEGQHLTRGLNDVKDGKAYHFFTYSRPAQKGSDALYKPERTTQDATYIPDEFYEEVEQSPFGDVLSRQKLKEDKLLSWLMRIVKISKDDLAQLPERTGLIGDAAHAVPIIGGHGGEQAITDALDLGNAITAGDADVRRAYPAFSENALGRWRESVERSVKTLQELHA